MIVAPRATGRIVPPPAGMILPYGVRGACFAAESAAPYNENNDRIPSKGMLI